MSSDVIQIEMDDDETIAICQRIITDYNLSEPSVDQFYENLYKTNPMQALGMAVFNEQIIKAIKLAIQYEKDNGKEDTTV